MNDIKLNMRLKTALPFVRDGGCFADIGTDHAYLPIFLVKEGRAERAVASDINEGPLIRARENIKKYGLPDRIKTSLCDGLLGIEDHAPDDIAIFGMGGELIVKIIDDAPWVKNGNIRLILQPMTHPEKLREYLFDEGFEIKGELLSKDRGRIYQTICAEYTGERHKCGGVGSLIGEHMSEYDEELLRDLVCCYIGIIEKKIAGKKKSDGTSLDEDLVMLEELHRILAEGGRYNER